MEKLSITLRSSVISVSAKQKRVIAGLGLKKLNQTVVREDTAPIRGMVEKVAYLLEVKKV